MDRYNLVSFVGLFVLLGMAWLLSANRRRLNWRCVGFGVGLQLLLGLVVFRAPGSRAVFLKLNDAMLRVLGAATAGQKLLFGRLALSPGETGPGGESSLGYFLAIQGLPVIIFFSALMALLYHWGVMQRIIQAFAWVFRRLMRVSGAESLCAASNIFVGIESATAIRPYLTQMTRSELCTILTAGMATIASSVLLLYVGFLKDVFPTIAGHLISASIMSAPAAIVLSKILQPETGEPVTMSDQAKLDLPDEGGSIASIIAGAMAGLKLVAGICALLIAFLGLVAIVNLILAGVGSGCQMGVNSLGEATGQGCSVQFDWSLEKLLGWVMYPFAVVIGVPPSDARLAGTMLGERLVATEIPAYIHLSEAMASGAFTHPRSSVVLAYALCGFAHVASMAIFVGGIAALVPARRKDLAAVGPRALLAATLACLMTGAIAGVFYHAGAGVLGN